MRTNSPEHYSSTEIHPHEKMACPLPRNYFGRPVQDMLPAYHRAFLAKWQRDTKDVEQQALSTKETVELSYNQHAKPLPNI